MRSCVRRDPVADAIVPGCRKEYGIEVCYCDTDGCNGGGDGNGAAKNRSGINRD
jgi:hypothetical protein